MLYLFSKCVNERSDRKSLNHVRSICVSYNSTSFGHQTHKNVLCSISFDSQTALDSFVAVRCNFFSILYGVIRWEYIFAVRNLKLMHLLMSIPTVDSSTIKRLRIVAGHVIVCPLVPMIY